MLPHGKDMCCLSTVESWSDTDITCTSDSHLDKAHPLRRNDILETISGIEFAAQAMAVHIALTNAQHNQPGTFGYLGGIRDLIVHVMRLDVATIALNIQATLLINQGTNFMYAFRLTTDTYPLLSGRASIFVQPPETQE